MTNSTFLIIDPIIYLLTLFVTPMLFDINVTKNDLCVVFLVFSVIKISINSFTNDKHQSDDDNYN